MKKTLLIFALFVALFLLPFIQDIQAQDPDPQPTGQPGITDISPDINAVVQDEPAMVSVQEALIVPAVLRESPCTQVRIVDEPLIYREPAKYNYSDEKRKDFKPDKIILSDNLLKLNKLRR